ncbi:response regulator transcription factor [Streptomyces sp. NPDC059063]|uniref:helix-turn-helix transcriptional regulator n=1 Tax=unclassified Streptomyces TaxID=2593676 RepID=UPI0036BDA21F
MATTGGSHRSSATGFELYQWLRDNGPSRPDAATGDLGLDGVQAAAAWAELRALHLVRPGPAPGVVEQVDPDIALLDLVRRQQGILYAQAEELADLAGATRVLVERYRPAAALGSGRLEVEVITSPARCDKTLRDFYELPLSTCRMLYYGPVGSGSQQSLDAMVGHISRMLSRQVTVACVYPQCFDSGRRQRRHLTELRRMGVEVRLVPQVPFSLILGDQDTALLPPAHCAPSGPLVVIRGGTLVRTFDALHTDYWVRSVPHRPADDSGGDGAELNEQLSSTLRLLGNGLTDERIARTLGVSVRTVSRLVSEIMQRLGAESRFQAGVLAQSQGLL